MAGRKKKQSISLDELIQHAFKNANSEEERSPSDERTPTTAQDLKNELRSNFTPSTRFSTKQLCAVTKLQAETKKEQNDAAAFAKEEREGQRPVAIVNSSAPAI